MYKNIIAGFAALIGMCAAVHAADLGGSLKDGPAPVASSAAPIWAGLYVGGSVGFGVGDTSGKITGFNFDRKDDEPEYEPSEALRVSGEGERGLDLGSLLGSDYDVNGAIYGAHVGFNLQRDALVFGIEAGFNGTNIDGSTDVLVFGKSERELDWYATLVARLGYASGKALFYGFGGVAWGTVETTLSVPVAGLSFSGESDHVGWTAGVGIEYAMTERFSVRVEYSHVDLGEETANIDLGRGLSLDDEVDLSFDAIKIGASYRFGGGDHGLEPLK